MEESTKLGEDLTKADRETLHAIADLISEYGVSPTWQEVAEKRGKKSAFCAAYSAGRLRSKGYVRWMEKAHRSIQLTSRGRMIVQPPALSDG